MLKWSVALYSLYRSKSWVINKAEERYLESFKMWCWLRLLRNSVLNEIGEPRGLLR